MSIYTLLNLMSEQGIDAYRVVSVLGYCLLPMVGVGLISVIVTLEYVFHRSYSFVDTNIIFLVGGEAFCYHYYQ